MKLSEAILLGSTLHPQGFGDFRVAGPISGQLLTCAWGAAHDAVGMVDDDDDEPLNWRWSTVEGEVHCPQEECNRTQNYHGTMIVHLNDEHKWSRERIAEWVATVEPAESQEAPAPEEFAPQEATR
jgi:hypothetical protein